MICMDNSEFMRNGDFSPTRFESQYDAVSMLITSKTNANPESTVGILTMAGRSVQVVASPTDEQAKLLSSLHGLSLGGSCNVPAALQVAMLALKHRNNKRGSQRIILFVGSPVEAEEKAMKRVGKIMKKNNIALDIISVGENAVNQQTLEGLLEAVNKNDNSHYVEVPPGMIASDVIRKSPIVGGGSSGASAAGGGDFGEFGGIDPNMDPEMAMALRLSMEEARQAGGGSDAPATGAPAEANMEDDEDALLQQALQMSMAAAMGDAGADQDVSADAMDSNTVAAEAESPASSPATASSEATAPVEKVEESSSIDAASEQFSDPSFVNQLLSDLPGVDMNDPQIQAAMAALGAGAASASDAQNKDKDKKEEK